MQCKDRLIQTIYAFMTQKHATTAKTGVQDGKKPQTFIRLSAAEIIPLFGNQEK